MQAVTFQSSMILAILPEIGLLVLAGVVLFFDMITTEARRRSLGWLTAGGLAAIGILAVAFSRPPEVPQLVLGGMLRQDWLTFAFRLIFLFGAAVTALFAMDSEKSFGRRGEFYILLVTATLGMSLMAASADLIMLYLAIETTSIPLYLLAGFLKDEDKSSESGFKYLLFGALTSAVMLYGFSLIYGFTGVTQIYELGGLLVSGKLPAFAMAGMITLVLVGFGFKISAVPLHFWAPDVYEGAPTPVAGFLSTASKAAGFAVLMRFLIVVFPSSVSIWSLLLAVIATASMILGNVMALSQKNLKRLLAYSSIAQAGYMLIGLAAVSTLGYTGATFYLAAYLMTNLAAFGVVAVAGRAVGGDDTHQFDGLSRRSPALALALLVALLSLGGIPPFGGFVGKLLVFAAAVQRPELVWLAVVGIINSIIALYYYLTVIKRVYLFRSELEDQPILVTRPWKVALIVCVAGVLLMGTLFAPVYGWAASAAGALF